MIFTQILKKKILSINLIKTITPWFPVLWFQTNHSEQVIKKTNTCWAGWKQRGSWRVSVPSVELLSVRLWGTMRVGGASEVLKGHYIKVMSRTSVRWWLQLCTHSLQEGESLAVRRSEVTCGETVWGHQRWNGAHLPKCGTFTTYLWSI